MNRSDRYGDEDVADNFGHYYGRPLSSFHEMLEYTNADVLKKMASHWGEQKRGANKQASIVTILAGLKSPQQVQRAIAECNPFEQVALRLLNQAGGNLEGHTLAITAAMLTKPPTDGRRRYSIIEWLTPLIETGLAHLNTPFSEYSLSQYHDVRVFAQPEVMRELDNNPEWQARPRPAPLELPAQPDQSASNPSQTLLRRPQAVALWHSTFVRAVDELGSIKVNRTGNQAVSTASINKLEKLMHKAGWRNSDDFALDGQPFPNPIHAYMAAARYGSLLKLDVASSTLKLAESAEAFGSQSYAAQTGILIEGLTQSPKWNENPSGPNDYYNDNMYGMKRAALRGLLCYALAGLPNTMQFIAIQDFSQALFQRIGQYFALGHIAYRPQPLEQRYRSFSANKLSPQEEKAQYEREMAKWREEIWRNWQNTEAPFITAAIRSWLYAWGLVELGVQNGECVSFRLTDLGREVFGDEAEQSAISSSSSTPPTRDAWVVQPNFEVLVYLERVSAPQLSLLERCAERTNADRHIATYRLTRNSIYMWLERGGETAALLSALEDGSAIPLPPNVKREMQDWAAQRERMTLRQFARLIEFQSRQERDDAMANGHAGTPIGERFLRLHTRGKLRVGFAKQIELINYAHPLPPCLTLSEDGALALDSKAKDLFISAQLDEWAEQRGNNQWQLTEASVRAAIKRGNKLDGLTTLLSARAKSKLPPLMPVVLAAWAGQAAQLALANVVAVRCSNPGVLGALMSSARFRPYLQGTLSADVALVDASKADEFRAALQWAGLLSK